MAKAECRWNARAVVPVECVVGGRVAWPQSLAAAGVAGGDAVCRRSSHGDHVAACGGRERRLPRLLLLPGRRRTQERIDCDAALGAACCACCPCPGVCWWCSTIRPRSVTARRSKGADVHHNPTPGPADQPFLYGHVWVTISLALRHPRWGSLALPLRALLYVRQRTIATIPRQRGWSDSPPSCNWRRGWWNGSFRS